MVSLPSGSESIAEPDFLSWPDRYDCLIDVRTPAEFAKDHLAGAINLPVLSNEERHEVGLLYKQSPFLGKQRGATLIARNIADHIEKRLAHYPATWSPLIYCWRGGKRSQSFVHILRQIGWRAEPMKGGYKAYRRHVIERLAVLPQRFEWRVISGRTGCGKTKLLQTLHKKLKATPDINGRHPHNLWVLDLEGLANHKGSVLGESVALPAFGLDHEGGNNQPSQIAFESALYEALMAIDKASRHHHRRPIVFVEAESRRIGSCHLPAALIETMRASPCIVLEAPMSVRLAIVLEEYHALYNQSEKLIGLLERLRAIQGASVLNEWRTMIDQKQWPALAESLMVKHYDPAYQKSLHKNFVQAPIEDNQRGEMLMLDSAAPEAFEQLAARLIQRFISVSRP